MDIEDTGQDPTPDDDCPIEFDRLADAILPTPVGSLETLDETKFVSRPRRPFGDDPLPPDMEASCELQGGGRSKARAKHESTRN
mmetsp:Transcript_86576/g.218032  ORF Transcript_86576/g.218032 Transcript_86576/m.218032 type:complete len:84 (-) Transcript_86576:33-284(-)